MPGKSTCSSLLLLFLWTAFTGIVSPVAHSAIREIRPDSAPDPACQCGTTAADTAYDFPELLTILGSAYRNAVAHDTPNPDPVATDLLLENAAIQLSSRVLAEITDGDCKTTDHAAPALEAQDHCIPESGDSGLRDVSDTLSYAAFRLEVLSRSTPAQHSESNRSALVTARLRSMEHLYRMLFSFAQAHFDRAEKMSYLEAAHDQLKQARKYLEIESRLCVDNCGCDCTGLRGLDQLEEKLSNVRTDIGDDPPNDALQSHIH